MQSVAEVLNSYNNRIKSAVESSVRELFESKHLYQSTNIDIDNLTKNFTKIVRPERMIDFAKHAGGHRFIPWKVHDVSISPLTHAFSTEDKTRGMIWTPPDVKLFCNSCDRLEPYNLSSASNVLEHKSNQRIQTQVFSLSYVCQSCKSIPEVFLLKRSDLKLTLCGRTPIEHVPVPKYVPKSVRGFFSDAIVAYQSGQILAALFLLRTVCEQWVRENTNSSNKADDALKEYMEKLPDSFKDRFPSIPDIYSQLSSAIHTLEYEKNLFDKSRKDLESHFDAIRVFKLFSN